MRRCTCAAHALGCMLLATPGCQWLSSQQPLCHVEPVLRPLVSGTLAALAQCARVADAAALSLGLLLPFTPCCRYLGSADAVRRNIGELKDEARGITPARDYVILSGAGDPLTGVCDFYCGWGWLALHGHPPHCPCAGWLACSREATCLQLGATPHAPRCFRPARSCVRYGLPADGGVPPCQERRRHHRHAHGELLLVGQRWRRRAASKMCEADQPVAGWLSCCSNGRMAYGWEACGGLLSCLPADAPHSQLQPKHTPPPATRCQRARRAPRALPKCTPPPVSVAAGLLRLRVLCFACAIGQAFVCSLTLNSACAQRCSNHGALVLSVCGGWLLGPHSQQLLCALPSLPVACREGAQVCGEAGRGRPALGAPRPKQGGAALRAVLCCHSLDQRRAFAAADYI